MYSWIMNKISVNEALTPVPIQRFTSNTYNEIKGK